MTVQAEPQYFTKARRAGRTVVDGQWLRLALSLISTVWLTFSQSHQSWILMLTLQITEVKGFTSLLCFVRLGILNASTGPTRFERLLLIGTSSSYLYLEALKAAIAEAKQGNDVQRYENAVSYLREIAPNDSDATPDLDWIDRIKKQVKGATDKMELELKGYKNNLIKESIRVCHVS